MQWTAFKWLIAFGAVAAAGAYAYETGSRLAEAQVGELRATANTLSERVATLETQLTREQAATSKAQSEAETWRQKYEEDIPSGDIRPLIEAMAHHLAAGVPPSRLLSAITNAADPAACEGPSTSKRLEVQTPQNRGSSATAGFHDRGVVLSVSGQSAQSATGDPQFWFDPEKPVTVLISKPGGIHQDTTGILPLFPMVTSGKTEYRFTVAASVRGFVQITMTKCTSS